MSFNIPSVASAASTAAARPGTPVSGTASTGPARPSAVDKAVNVDISTAIPASPPQEVHDAMAVASQSYHRLATQNRQLQFRIDDGTGKLTVEVHDLQGNLLFTVPAHKALDIAGGGSLE
jgi:hypothetical protein